MAWILLCWKRGFVGQEGKLPWESDAVRVSEVLPFVEYDVQRQLMLKMRVRGMNAAFGYKSNIQVGSNMVVAVATCTAVYLEALPPPPAIKIMQPLRDLDAQLAAKQHMRLAALQSSLEELWGYYQRVLEGHQELTDTRAREDDITNASTLVTQTAAPSPLGSEKLMGRDKGSSGKRDAKRGNKEEVKRG